MCFSTNYEEEEGRIHFDEIDPIPFRFFYIDHLAPFVKTKRTNCYIFAIYNDFSKYLVVKLVQNTKTTFWITNANCIERRYGFHVKII